MNTETYHSGCELLYTIPSQKSRILQEIPYEIAPRRKGDVDSLYASCARAEEASLLHWNMLFSSHVRFMIHFMKNYEDKDDSQAENKLPNAKFVQAVNKLRNRWDGNLIMLFAKIQPGTTNLGQSNEGQKWTEGRQTRAKR